MELTAREKQIITHALAVLAEALDNANNPVEAQEVIELRRRFMGPKVKPQPITGGLPVFLL